jgi:hypothetical protein
MVGQAVDSPDPMILRSGAVSSGMTIPRYQESHCPSSQLQGDLSAPTASSGMDGAWQVKSRCDPVLGAWVQTPRAAAQSSRAAAQRIRARIVTL